MLQNYKGIQNNKLAVLPRALFLLRFLGILLLDLHELVLHFYIGRKFFQGSHFIHVKNLKGQEIGSEGCQTPIFIIVINANRIMIFNLPQESGIYRLVWLI